MAIRREKHHGGAWKVAYADFVTAMMALFLVLWLTSQDEKIKEAVERSFRNPFMTLTKESTGIVPNKEIQAVRATRGSFDSASAIELYMLRKLSDDIVKTLESNPELPDESPVKLEMVPEGLRISVFDRTRKPIFQQDSAKFTDYGQWVFSTLAWQVARFTNAFNVELEGHSESGRKMASDNYSAWEVTADRANAARRRLLQHGVADEQIRKVAGYADTAPMKDRDPTHESNSRVTVLLTVRAGNRFQAE